MDCDAKWDSLGISEIIVRDRVDFFVDFRPIFEILKSEKNEEHFSNAFFKEKNLPALDNILDGGTKALRYKRVQNRVDAWREEQTQISGGL